MPTFRLFHRNDVSLLPLISTFEALGRPKSVINKKESMNKMKFILVAGFVGIAVFIAPREGAAQAPAGSSETLINDAFTTSISSITPPLYFFNGSSGGTELVERQLTAFNNTNANSTNYALTNSTTATNTSMAQQWWSAPMSLTPGCSIQVTVDVQTTTTTGNDGPFSVSLLNGSELTTSNYFGVTSPLSTANGYALREYYGSPTVAQYATIASGATTVISTPTFNNPPATAPLLRDTNVHHLTFMLTVTSIGSMQITGSIDGHAYAPYTITTPATTTINTVVVNPGSEVVNFSNLVVSSFSSPASPRRIAPFDAYDPAAPQYSASHTPPSPTGTCVLPITASGDLANALKYYQIVVLQKGKYTTGVTLGSNQQLYGDAGGTTVPAITIPAGTTGTVISDLGGDGSQAVTFGGAGTAVTSGNYIQNMTGYITIQAGADLEDNLFLNNNIQLAITTTGGGYLRNNRFIRTIVSGGWDLSITGDTTSLPSYGNVFLWCNFLVNFYNPTTINDPEQDDLTFAGVNGESWNSDATGTTIGTGQRQLFYVPANMGTLRIFSIGTSGAHNAVRPGDYSINASEFQLYADTLDGDPVTSPNPNEESGTETNTDGWLEADCARSLLLYCNHVPTKTWTDLNTDSPFRLFGFDVIASGTEDINPTLETGVPQSSGTTNSLTTSQQTTLKAMVIKPTRGDTGSQPWEQPTFDAAPDPAGPNWQQQQALRTSAGNDDSTYIQGLMGTTEDPYIGHLPPGIYYISHPLTIGPGQGLVGEGTADNTVIISTNPASDLIDVTSPAPTGGNHATSVYHLAFANISLQGGRNGIVFGGVDTDGTLPGNSGQYSWMYFNHVTFRNMVKPASGSGLGSGLSSVTGSGIYMNNIYGLDNNMLSFTNFIDCDAGVLQVVPAGYVNGTDTSTMTYMDKCVWYKSQFIGDTQALNLLAERVDNTDSWIDCLFQNNTAGVALLPNCWGDIFANCQFTNNGNLSGRTATMEYSGMTSFASCNFQTAAGTAIFGGPSTLDGCAFSPYDGATGSTIFASTAGNAFVSNSTSTSAVPTGLASITGTYTGGMLINNTFPATADSNYNYAAVYIDNGTTYNLLPGVSATPQAEILYGDDFNDVFTAPNNY